MIDGIRYTHTNIIARDWRSLAGFYEFVMGCTPVPPERDYSGPELEAITGLAEAGLVGVHLRLPGSLPGGPTLEIYSVTPQVEGPPAAINRPGLAHLAFEVDSVPEARQQVLGAGGTDVGEIATLTTATGAHVTLCYMTDPEGNIIELQSWS